jgi:carboxylesterase type B
MFHNVVRSQRPFEAVDRKLSDAIATYLVRFVKAGNPNASGLLKWNAYSEKREELMSFGGEITTSAVPAKAALDLFESVFAKRSNAASSAEPFEGRN